MVKTVELIVESNPCAIYLILAIFFCFSFSTKLLLFDFFFMCDESDLHIRMKIFFALKTAELVAVFLLILKATSSEKLLRSSASKAGAFFGS